MTSVILLPAHHDKVNLIATILNLPETEQSTSIQVNSTLCRVKIYPLYSPEIDSISHILLVMETMPESIEQSQPMSISSSLKITSREKIISKSMSPVITSTISQPIIVEESVKQNLNDLENKINENKNKKTFMKDVIIKVEKLQSQLQHQQPSPPSQQQQLQQQDMQVEEIQSQEQSESSIKLQSDSLKIDDNQNNINNNNNPENQNNNPNSNPNENDSNEPFDMLFTDDDDLTLFMESDIWSDK